MLTFLLQPQDEGKKYDDEYGSNLEDKWAMMFDFRHIKLWTAVCSQAPQE